MDSNIYVISRLGASQQDSHKVCAANGSWSLSGNDKVLVIQLPVGLSACLPVCLSAFLYGCLYIHGVYTCACMCSRASTHAGTWACTYAPVGLSDVILVIILRRVLCTANSAPQLVLNILLQPFILFLFNPSSK